MLWKGVYLYEDMDNLEKVSETSLPEKEDFYSHLNMEDITQQITHTQKEFVKTFKQKT